MSSLGANRPLALLAHFRMPALSLPSQTASVPKGLLGFLHAGRKGTADLLLSFLVYHSLIRERGGRLPDQQKGGEGKDRSYGLSSPCREWSCLKTGDLLEAGKGRAAFLPKRVVVV